MGELFYVGPDPTTDQEVENLLNTDALLNTGVSRDYAQERIDTAVALKAPKTYVDTQDELYEDTTYHVTQNSLLVPNSARGAANGVASLDSSGKVPTAQVPHLGVGILKGPYGPTTTFGPATGSTPAKVAEWSATNYGINGWPLVFMNISTVCTSDRTVIEVRIGTSTQTAYADQTLIAQGFGRHLYTDWQTITVMPVPAQDDEGQDGVQDYFAAATNWLITAWMYNSGTGSSQTNTGQISTAALFWARNTL